MKIRILIPLWQRSALFKLCSANIRQFIKHSTEHEVKVLVVISPEDPEAEELTEISLKHKFDCCFTKNDPLSDKLNYGISYSLQFEYDYLMNFGSDDLIHPDIWKLYAPMIEQKKQLFGVSSLYFYQADGGATIYYKNEPHSKSVGAGRMIGRELIMSMKRKKLLIYDRNRSRGLDSSSSTRMTGFMSVRDISVDGGRFPYIVDIKTETNINSFWTWKRVGHRAHKADARILRMYYPKAGIF